MAKTADRFAAERFGSATARAILAGDEQARTLAWREMVDLGWAGLLVPEQLGGTGGSLLDGVLIAEALTRRLAPVPFIGSALIGVTALTRLGADVDDLLRRVAEGTQVCLVVAEDLRWPPPSGPALALDWWPGSIPLVPASGGITGGSWSPSAGEWNLDALHPVGRIDGLEVVASEDPEKPEVQLFLAAAYVSLAAGLVGVMAGALDLAVGYAKERQQFGRPIGSFQAVQHLCADMLVDLEVSRSVAYAAAWMVDHEPDLDRVVLVASSAKAWCAEAAVRACENATQVHGGMGITWECDVHLYLRQAHLFGSALGSADDAYERVGRMTLRSALRKG